jgi:hypothetical protein
MEDHVNWPTQMGARVLINDGWYKAVQPDVRTGRPSDRRSSQSQV